MIRQRKSGAVSVLTKLKEFDVYPKVEDDYKVKTTSGGAVTIVSGLVMVFLFLSELNSYLSVETVDHIIVDTTRGAKLRINFNISFPALSCAEVALDAMDVSGEQQVDIIQTVAKQRLQPSGLPVPADVIAQEEKEVASRVSSTTCGSCYGAGDPGQCCNTCSAVKEAYMRKGWDAMSVETTAEQCQRSQMGKKGEGCTLYGFLLVNKVGGNFHVALGAAHSGASRHTHQVRKFVGDLANELHGPYTVSQFRLSESDSYNTSHVINKLNFGEEFPGIKNPLDGLSRTILSGTGVFQYFIKIVPTNYRKANGQLIESNQFSVTEQFRPIDFRSGVVDASHALPGVFFVYDLSPFMVDVVEKTMPFTHFLTSVCAIIGGVFTVAGIIDSVVYHSSRHILKRKSALAE